MTDESYKARANKFKLYAVNGCSCISFYDFIRFYDVNLLFESNRFIIEIPIAYLSNLINKTDTQKNKYMNKLIYRLNKCAEYISYTELLYYDKFRDYLSYNCLHGLSRNSNIPLSYIISSEHSKWSWNWSFICQFNHSFELKHLTSLENLIDWTYLSSNSSILLEWVLLHSEKPWSFNNLCTRLYIKEIRYLHNHPIYQTKLVWYNISNYNPHIDLTIINNNPDLPWNLYPKDYGRWILNNSLDLNDIIDEFKGRTESLKQYSSYISRNRNITYDIISSCKYIFNREHLQYNIMDCPKLQQTYKNLYQRIIIEINYS